MNQTMDSSQQSEPKLSPGRFANAPITPQDIGTNLPFKKREGPALAPTFHSLSRMGKLNAILELSSPEAFVQELPSQELHHLIHHIGIEDAGLLVPHTTPDQFRTLLDLDLWVGSEMCPERIERWIWSLDEFGPSDELARRIQQVDPELIISILARWCRIQVRETKDESPMFPHEAVVFTTPDQRYFVELVGDDANDRFPMIYHLIGGLYQADLEQAIQLLDQITMDTPSEVEEEVLRFRNARLQDLGFVSPDEAIRMYAFTSPKKALGDLAAILDGPAGSVFRHEGRPLGTALLGLGAPDNFLATVLGQTDCVERQEQFITAFTYLCNRSSTVRILDLSDLDRWNQEAKTIFGHLNIGLEFLAQGNHEAGGKILEKMHLLELHRVGFSVVTELSHMANTILKTLGSRDAQNLFDSPYAEVISALSSRFPCYTEVVDGGLIDRPFKSLYEVDRLRALVRDAQVSAELFNEHFGVKALEVDAADEAEMPYADVRLSSLWLTLLCQNGQNGTATLQAITIEQANQFVAALCAAPDQTIEKVTDASMSLLEQLSIADDLQVSALRRALIEPAAQRFADAFNRVQDHSYDPNILADFFLVDRN
ncbi:MAG: hypothetical protein CMH54_12905 [Myxococcales bacterium]|nr:hypothetical protein [Myxococcales bacterium]